MSVIQLYCFDLGRRTTSLLRRGSAGVVFVHQEGRRFSVRCCEVATIGRGIRKGEVRLFEHTANHEVVSEIKEKRTLTCHEHKRVGSSVKSNNDCRTLQSRICSTHSAVVLAQNSEHDEPDTVEQLGSDAFASF